MINIHTNRSIRAKLICAVIFLWIFAVLMAFRSAPAEASGKSVAKVNGTVLTEVDLEEALNEIMPAAVFHGGFSSAKRAKYRPQAFEKMIDKELLYQEALEIGMTVPKEKIEADMDKTIKRFGSKRKYKAALERAGLSDKKYREKIRKKYLVAKIIAVEITQKVQVTDEEVKLYYQKHKKQLLRPESRRITHIMIKVAPNAASEERHRNRRRAQEVIDKIKAGENMSTLAWNYSEDDFRVKGGDMGLVHSGRLDPDLEKEVFKLAAGQLSGIIETRFGYHIVRVEEVRPPEQLSLEEVFPKIMKKLTEKKEKQLREQLIGRLRAQAKIEKYASPPKGLE